MGAQKTSSKKKSTTLQYLFDLDSKTNTNNGGNYINSNNSLTAKISSFEAENEELLSIISYCNTVFTFTDPTESQTQQDYKRIKLAELLSIVKATKKPLDDRIMSPLISMLATNLFRPLPPPSNPSALADFPDDEDPMTMPIPSWPHLQFIYDILQRLVLNSESKTLRGYIDHPFLINLLYLFQSEDPRERDRLKNVYHRIYSKFTFYRSFMRKSMNDVFIQFVFETDRHSGIGELLEIWGSIINGFTVPLKEEHKLFLMRVLIPLHKPKGMQAYHTQLAYCVSQFVHKEPALGCVAVKGILRYWPITNCQKEVLLIGELEELVENLDPEEYQNLAKPLCSQIVRCLNSWNSQVSERALYVWNNEHFVKMASKAIDEVFPVIVEGLEKNLNWHWSKSVRQLTSSVKTMLDEMEPILYSKCLRGLEMQEYLGELDEQRRKEKWERIEMAADQNQFVQTSQGELDEQRRKEKWERIEMAADQNQFVQTSQGELDEQRRKEKWERIEMAADQNQFVQTSQGELDEQRRKEKWERIEMAADQNQFVQTSQGELDEQRRKEKWERIEMAADQNQFVQTSQCISVSN